MPRPGVFGNNMNLLRGFGSPHNSGVPSVLVGGFNKPPPAPHSNAGSHPYPRSRGHSLGDMPSTIKEKLGGGSQSTAPPNREKSPNGSATIPDFHDCSMCLSAYIQSLNTVCGSASRLSQCLAGLSNMTSTNNSSIQQSLRETCDGWESLTRAVGVASASVKMQMLALLQEAIKVPPAGVEEASNQAGGQEIEKLLSSLCSNFLTLQCWFSSEVLETFSPFTGMMLNQTASSIDTPQSQYSTPITPPHFSQLTPTQGGIFFPTPSSPSSINARTRANSMHHLTPKSESSTVRRWSMGAHGNTNAPPHSEKQDNTSNVSGPGPPRRWSVPETNEQTAVASPNSQPWSSASGATPWSLHQPSGVDETTRRLNVPTHQGSSRESSIGGTRSNSHSRSATPEATKYFLSNDELDDLVDIVNSDKRGSSVTGGRSPSSHSRLGGGSVSSVGDEKESASNDRKSPFSHHQKNTPCHHRKVSTCQVKAKLQPKKISDPVKVQLEPKPPDEKGTNKSKMNSGGKKSGNFLKGQTRHSKQRSYQQYINKQQQSYNYSNLHQFQLQQYLYQQQMQANAFLKLSPISSSILKQQHQQLPTMPPNYLSLIQNQLYQQQQMQQNLKLQQSLHLLHLQQQKFGQQYRKNSLQNIGSYHTEVGAPHFHYETPDDSSCNTSRRSSSNTIISSCSSAGNSGRTPVIPESSTESSDNSQDRLTLNQQHWLKHNRNMHLHSPSIKPPTIQMEGRTVDAPILPEVVTTSTPLWPPSGSVPGVTLTECVEDFRPPPAVSERQTGWPQIKEEFSENKGPVAPESWSSAHPLWGPGGFSLGGLIEEASSFGELLESQQQSSKESTNKSDMASAFGNLNIRRHSTDPSLFHQQHQSEFGSQPPPLTPSFSPGRNSRSSDNLTLVQDLNEQPNLETLLSLNAFLPNSSPSSPTAHYSLFNN